MIEDPGTVPATTGDPDDGATAAPDAPAPSIAAVEERFRRVVDDQVRAPIFAALDRYRASLAAIVEEVESLAVEEPEVELDETAVRRDPGVRHEYADRFAALIRKDILEPADQDRARLFARIDAVPTLDHGLPETVTTDPAKSGAAAPKRVRPRASSRLYASLRKPGQRTLPTGPLGRLYMAVLAARLEPAANVVASLDAVAFSLIRRELSVHAGPVARAGAGRGAEELQEAAASARRAVDGAIEEVTGEFVQAIRAPAVRVGEEDAKETAERAARRRTRILEDWQSFETALRANTRSEAVLARALAALDVGTTRAASELEAVLDARAHQPLTRLAAELAELAGEARDRLGRRPDAATIEALREETSARFAEELEDVTERLGPELEEVARRFVADLETIPDTVPAELQISEEPISRIPDDPETLELRDAPVDELLRTACEGAIPRVVERGLEATTRELEALSQELTRVRNAVDFHIRAPLRGDFGGSEGTELIIGSMERAASQLEDLRENGLDSVERLITELERVSAQEAEAVRSAVADREFLRIRTEIAEEQAARSLSTGLAWGRRLAEVGLRIARAGWSAGRRSYDLTQDWAERQLGVGAVEREEMLESLEASLLGEEQARVELPGLYRQLMDVEGEVPWEELLVARPEEVATLGRALDRWRRGQAASVAIVGEKGSGKTTLLRMVGDLFGDTPVRTIDLGSTMPDPEGLARRIAEALDVDAGDWSELAEALRAGGPTVAVVEDAHHMFLRTLGGFRAMEAFLEAVAATRQQVLWVITMDEYAWRYLDRALGIAPHFTHTVSTTNLSPEALERAIMARHEVSGFSLRFELQEDGTRSSGWWNRIRRKKETQGELTRRELERRAFFRELNQIAEGNIFLALFYWLRSVERVDDHVLVLRSPRIIDLEFLERLPLPSLHTIAGIILHGGLSEDEHRQVFQLSPAEARLQLAALADAHLVFRSSDGEYKVNKVLYRPLTRLMKTKNIF